MIQDAWVEGREHIEKLCKKHGLKIEYIRHKYQRNSDGIFVPICGYIPAINTIEIQTINNEFNYLAALHEIGHAVYDKCRVIIDKYGPYGHYSRWGKRDILDNEAYAWEWACTNSIYGLGIEPMAMARSCFMGYYDYFINLVEDAPKSTFFYALLNY